MELNYHFQKTDKIRNLLEDLSVIRKVVDLLPQLPHIEENLRRESLLKSSLFSARIEGNKLRLEDINYLSLPIQSKDIPKIEVANILKALHWIYDQTSKKLTLRTIFRLHKLVLDNLSTQAGYLRQEPSAIFNQAGIAIYLPPPPSEIKNLVEKLINTINLSQDKGTITAAVSHFSFEKIHPFLDGNGRVGRLLSTLILKNAGYGFRGLVSLEEYLEEKRQNYYDLLAVNKKDITDFVEFFLEGLKIQAQKTMEKIKNSKIELPEDTLLPRRREILEIIKNQKLVSFDFLKRRFQNIPDSTLHYDLGQLLKTNFIKKLGTSRGALYIPKSSY